MNSKSVKSHTDCKEQTSPLLWNTVLYVCLIQIKQSCFDSSNEEIICCTDEVRCRQGREKAATLSVKQTNKKPKITHFKAIQSTSLLSLNIFLNINTISHTLISVLNVVSDICIYQRFGKHASISYLQVCASNNFF